MEQIIRDDEQVVIVAAQEQDRRQGWTDGGHVEQVGRDAFVRLVEQGQLAGAQDVLGPAQRVISFPFSIAA
jgi:hypothetical protein